MTTPKHSRATDKGRYYSHPVTGQMLISITNVLDQKNKPALVPWASKLSAEYAIQQLPRLAALSRTPAGREQALKEIKAQANVVRERASDLGTRIHAAAEQHLLGTGAPVDDDVRPFLAQYLRFLTDWDVDIDEHVVHAELTVASPTLGVAGTLDLRVLLPLEPGVDGRPGKRTTDGKRYEWTVDTKSSLTKGVEVVYPEVSLQIAAQRFCEEMWLPDDTVARNLRTVGGAVLNLRADDYALIPVPCGQREWDAYQALLAVAKWDHARKDDPTPVRADGKAWRKPAARRARKTTQQSTTAGKAA